MISLRIKFILALLITSLVSIALAGYVARWMLLRDFGQMVLERSFDGFRSDVASYIRTYGSWQEAQAQEDFGHFSDRVNQGRRDLPEDMADSGPLGSAVGPGLRTSARIRQTPPARQPGPPGGGPQGGFGGPQGGFGGPQGGFGGPQGGFEPMDGEMGMAPDGMPPPPPPNGDRGGDLTEEGPMPPFRFLLYDPQGKILVGDDEHATGSQVPDKLRQTAVPVLVSGKLQAWAVPLSVPNLSAREQRYLTAIDQAVMVAMVLAFFLALGLGILVGNQLGGDLRTLTFAIQAIGRGELRQQVKVRSRDEIGILADAFNGMSADLARTQEELQQSSAQIGAQAELLKELSVRDGLTRLYNRRYFDEQAATMYAQAQRSEHLLTMVIADVDNFKRINDTFSHATGDEVLRRVGSLLQSSLRQSDVVARYGGEEFVIALYRTPVGRSAQLCEKLRRIVEEHPWHEIHPELKVTMSFGLSDNLGLGSFEKMLAEADRQLYRAKETGRNRVCFEGTAEQENALPHSCS